VRRLDISTFFFKTILINNTKAKEEDLFYLEGEAKSIILTNIGYTSLWIPFNTNISSKIFGSAAIPLYQVLTLESVSIINE
jgi:hypothetical protein